jgi:hypothetical protein
VGLASVVTPVQQRFLGGFFREERCPFYLSGGTALSGFYLQHRYSDDLDFFTRDRESLRAPGRYVEQAAAAAELQIERVVPRGDLVQYCFSGDSHPDHPLLKSELVFDAPRYFADPRRLDGVLVDDLLSIAVNKLTIHTRHEPKDYVDLYMVVQSGHVRLEDLIPMAKEKLVGRDELAIAAHFSQVDELPNLEAFQQAYMVAPTDLADLRRWYRDWATRLIEAIPPLR